jgi:hypothetical protein
MICFDRGERIKTVPKRFARQPEFHGSHHNMMPVWFNARNWPTDTIFTERWYTVSISGQGGNERCSTINQRQGRMMMYRIVNCQSHYLYLLRAAYECFTASGMLTLEPDTSMLWDNYSTDDNNNYDDGD